MGTGVTAVRQDHDGVEVRTGAGPARARYLLGCDGGRSTVREQLGIRLAGRSHQEVWLVADVLDDHHDERYGMHHGDPDRPHVIIPGSGGRCRYEFLLRPDEGPAGERPPDELVRTLLARYRDVRPEQVERAVPYRFHSVVAQAWRAGRAFLLGDAAHMMPPFAGQGLNSGIRDAGNLVGKIVDVLAGRLDDTALDSYETERRPHVEATVRLSGRLGRVVMTTDTRLARRRDALVRRALATESGRRHLEEMRYRSPQRLDAGLVVPAAGPSGLAVGQPTVIDTVRHRMRPLDEVLGAGWALVGVGVAPGALRTEAATVATLDPAVVHVPLADRVPARHPLDHRRRPAGRVLLRVAGFRISDHLADGNFAWLRSNRDHHTLAVVNTGSAGLDHYSSDLAEWEDFKAWCDRLTELGVDVVWGPGRHGPGNNLFIFFDDPAGTHVELSAEMQKFHDDRVVYTTRRWEPVPRSVNLWGGQLANWRTISGER